MKQHRFAVVAGLALIAGAAQAGSYTITPTIATDYDFRGSSQTDPIDQNGKPAFQVGGTYTFDQGFYAGAWGSNVDDSIQALGIDGDNIELDFYGGYAWGDASTSFAYDAGLIAYTYPGFSDANTVEGYINVSRDFYSAKLSYSPDVGSSGDSGFYAEVNANYPMSTTGLSLLGHAGKVFGQAYNGRVDFSAGVGYAVGKLDFAVKYVDGNKDIKSRVIGSISTTLPWGE